MEGSCPLSLAILYIFPQSAVFFILDHRKTVQIVNGMAIFLVDTGNAMVRAPVPFSMLRRKGA